MKFFPPRRRVWRTAIYMICIVLVLVALDLLWARWLRTIHPGYATTRIVEPVQPNGLIDYLTPLEDHFSQGVTVDNNAAPLLLKAFGRSAIPSNQPANGITDRLGMAPLPENGDYFLSWETFTKGREKVGSETSPSESALNHAWPEPSPPLTVEWLSANEKALATVVEATRRPRFFLPYNGGNRPALLLSILLPHVKPIREASDALLARAMHRLQMGDPAGAKEDLLAVHRLARLLGQAPTLVERSVAYAMEANVNQADRAAVATSKFDAAALRQFAADLAALPEFESPAECIQVSERFLILDATQFLAHSNPLEAGRLYDSFSNGSDVPAEMFAFLPIPYERIMVEANQWYDGLALALGQATFAKRQEAVEEWERGVTAAAHNRTLGLLTPSGMLRTFVPSLTRIHLSWEATRAGLRLTQTALSLSLYQSEKGEYPPALSGLATAAPTDPFTERPFIYSRTADGYQLYSVGPNRIDEGGKHEKSADDISANVVRAK